MAESKITRRSFLKASVIASVAAAVGAAAPSLATASEVEVAAADSEMAFYNTICHGCIASCPCRAYVKDGVVVKIEGHPDAPISQGSLCLKGLNQIHTCYSPRRILYPMKRTSPRGAANATFERISWDEAIDLAATKIAESFEKYSTYSLIVSTGGGGSYSRPSMTASLPMAFGAPNFFEPGSAQCLLPRLSIAAYMYGGSCQSLADGIVTECYKGMSKADKAAGITGDTSCLVIWGTQPSASGSAQQGRGIAELRARGCDTIVVDPKLTADAARATVHLPLRPGSDAALILSWYRVILDEKLYDEEFTKFFTNMPFLINPETNLPWLASEVFEDYVATTPENTPVYVCVDEDTGEIAPLPYGMPADVRAVVNPQVVATAVVNGLESRSAGQIYRDEAEPWTLERAEEFCWVPAERNRAAIDLYTHPKGGTAGITHGVATDMQETSSQAPIGLCGLDMIMGYVYKPGTTLTAHGAKKADGEAKRPTVFHGYIDRFGKQVGVGWETGATKEANEARVNSVPDEYDPNDPDAKPYFTKATQWAVNQMQLDRLGMNNHRGLFTWMTAHIPSIREAAETGDPYKVAVWLDLSSNKLAVLGSAGAWYNVCMNGGMDYIIAQHPMMTSFHIELADLVLPVEEWLEATGASDGQLNYGFPCPGIVHLGETVPHTVPPTLIVDALSEKVADKLDSIQFGTTGKSMAELGLAFPIGQGFTNGNRSEDELWARQIKNFGPEGMQTKEEFMEFAKNNSELYKVNTPPEDYWTYDQHLVIADAGLPVGFAPESRKCEVYCSALITLSQTGLPICYPRQQDPIDPRAGSYGGSYSPICNVPMQKEAPEVPNSEGYIMEYDPNFPLALTSGRVYHYHHGTMRHAPFARELYPAPFASINPETAAEYGIESGDWIEISSRRTVGTDYDPNGVRGTEMGYAGTKEYNTKVGEPIHAIAKVSSEVAPKVVWMERFWNPECYDASRPAEERTGGWAECSVNVLTNAIDPCFNEVYGSYTNRAFAVQIAKSERPAGIWVEPKEFEPLMPTTPNMMYPEVGVLRDNPDLRTATLSFGGAK